MAVVSLRPAIERGGTLVLVLAPTARLLHPFRITQTNGVSLTKAIEIQHGDQGLSSACTKRALNVYAPSIYFRIAIPQTTPSPRSASPEYPNPQLKSGEDTPATHMPNTHSQRSLSQHIKVATLANLEVTTAKQTGRAIMIGRRSSTVAAVVAKKSMTRAKATIVGKKTPEVPGMINTMRTANNDITRRDHIQRPKRSCQIITLP